MKYIFVLSALLISCQPKSEPSKWEYKIQTIPDGTFIKTMDSLGSDRWELIFARRASDGEAHYYSTPTFSYEVIFKRPAIRKED